MLSSYFVDESLTFCIVCADSISPLKGEVIPRKRILAAGRNRCFILNR